MLYNSLIYSVYVHTLSAHHYNYDRTYTCRRKIRLIEGSAICRHLKNLPVKGLCGRCYICLRLRTPYLVLYILIYTEKGVGEFNQIEG
jgi:hypothetical protein